MLLAISRESLPIKEVCLEQKFEARAADCMTNCDTRGGSVQLQCPCAGDRPPEVLIGVCTINLVKEGTLPMFLEVRPLYHLSPITTSELKEIVTSMGGCIGLY